jgi:hypothetical protein
MHREVELPRFRAAARVAAATSVFISCVFVFCQPTRLHGQATDVLTFHNDNSRTGQALNEQILTPANVNTNHFGRLWVLNTDGKVDAQPLYAAGVPMGQGLSNVLLVATENDTVYAFNADGTNIWWRASMLGTNETPSDNRSCSQVAPVIGVTATPVIDRGLGPHGTVFVVAMSKDTLGNYYQRLHALDLATGTNRLGPVTITATNAGTGPNSSGGFLSFNPAQYEDRCGLLLLHGVIYTAWTSHCDKAPYNGWIIGYDEQTLAQTTVLDLTPNGTNGALWMSGDGPAADSSGNIYVLDGNGSFDTNLDASGFPTNRDFGNAFIKMATTNGVLTPVDYFATFSNVFEINNDFDLGSGGVVLLPDMADALGNTRQLAVGAGKDAKIYLVDRTNMGKFNPSDNSAIYQEVAGALGGRVASTPAYFNGHLYYCAWGDYLKAFTFQNALLSTTPTAQSPATFAYPGSTPSVSANGTSNGIVWAVASNLTIAVLHAYNATNVGIELYNSNLAPTNRDNFGPANKFITPTIASARVYVGTTTNVGVFGLLDTSTLTPLEIWRQNNFGNPSNVGAGADDATPAGDGVPNLVKYALGLPPFVAATAAQLPTGGLQPDPTNGVSYLTLSVNRAAQPPDVSYLVEVSGDLQNWVFGAPNTVTLTNTPNQLVVRDNTPVANSTGRFIRLVISNP